MKIDISYGSGGKQTSSLINDIFLKNFDNEVLNKLEDAAVLDVKNRIAYTTDSFVVTPMFFKGGNIGKLAICGTVNDLSMMGARPRYLTAGFIIEAGADSEMIDQIAHTMRVTAEEAGVKIVAGDTKVIEGNGNVYINTSGVGEILKEGISIQNCHPGDMILLSGNLGEHHAAIMSERMGIENNIASDCAPLFSIVSDLLENDIEIRCMRDVTRGGLATVLNEVSESSKCRVEIEEEALPVSDEVKGFCNILGLDPLYMANEGKMIAVIPGEQSQKAVEVMRKNKYGSHATIIGKITEGNGVNMTTALGGNRMIDILYGEGLPRIC
ncbi:hydrogenase expression/formation protein HypE [Aminipila terrae]|uniref:Hydrogenase expression/formation protein HypE n=1 Tax=Aminipila terrae TaxID=2697030 RepID=A0A6P1MB75_9FIRM|nr:hydrogenase expression/formation protein HypE [Aminipila terrae]QHI71101.1 hydrogenase expression/formation protein HypE [Aminipila terrae]